MSGRGVIDVSFEFAPARSVKTAASRLEDVKALAAFGPRFMSVTYGMGGATPDATLAMLGEMKREVKVPLAGHLTCAGASRDEVDAVARAYWEGGVRHVMALRGDGGPSVGAGFVPHPQGYGGALDLIRGLKRIAPFEISVAGYPEGHPAAVSLDADLAHLRAKVDAGADRVLTQFFFEAETFLRFRDRAVAMGIETPIVPGILPVWNVERVWQFSAMCGVSVPGWMREMFAGLAEPSHVAVAVADRLCQRLRAEGVEAFHFFTGNRADMAAALCRLLGVSETGGEASGFCV